MFEKGCYSVVLVQLFGFLRLILALFSVWMIRTTKQIRSRHMYFSHHKIIKYVGFKSIHCAINLNVTSSLRVFSKFDFLFI